MTVIDGRRNDLERQKFDLERTKYKTELGKWIVLALGAIVSFIVIDWGKLRLERQKVSADGQRQLLDSYLKATESADPEIWKRKLHVVQSFANDSRTNDWVKAELQYIDQFAEQDALYREAAKTASQLVEPSQLNDPERKRARTRFEQLAGATRLETALTRGNPRIASIDC